MNIYGLFFCCCFLFLCTHSVLCTFFPSRPFVVDLKMSLVAVFPHPFSEGTVEDFCLERVCIVPFFVDVFISGVGGSIALFPFCYFQLSAGVLCRFLMGHDSDMCLRR